MALHILLVDDESHARSHLAALLEDFPNVTVAGSVSGGAEAISFLRRTAVDLIFLDIEMGDVSGFDLARHIQSVYPKVMLVFLTGHVDFALNGYEFQPLDFLIKPVNPLRLERVILQAEEQLGKRTPKTPAVRVGLQVNGGLEIIQVDSILYIEKQGRKVYLVPAKGSRYQSYDTMQTLQGIFELYGFFRCHQSFLVRLDAIQGVYLDETRKCHKILLFGTEEQIPLSRGKYPEPLERVRRALPLCVIWGALFAITPRTGWQLALIVPLFFLLGAAVWLLLRPPLLCAAAAAVLAALIAGTLELLQTVAGPFVVPAAFPGGCMRLEKDCGPAGYPGGFDCRRPAAGAKILYQHRSGADGSAAGRNLGLVSADGARPASFVRIQADGSVFRGPCPGDPVCPAAAGLCRSSAH